MISEVILSDFVCDNDGVKFMRGLSEYRHCIRIIEATNKVPIGSIVMFLTSYFVCVIDVIDN